MEATNSSLPSAAKERQYSDNISRRRKGLFQSDGDMFKTNNELGLINTLNDAVGYLEGTVDKETSLHSLEDYIIYDRIEVSTPKGRSLISSPYQTIISETPLKQSPSEKLKTPNDSYSHNEKIPKLIRKSLLDTSFSEANNQNLTTPISSPKSKSEGSLVKSKVCTALFPDDMALPVKSFYPKTTDNRIERFHHDVITNVQKPTHKPKVSYICNRRRIKNCFGQINAGVRHKIKKPKNKNSRKDQIMKAVENIIENSPLNEYLEGIAKLKLQKDATRQQTIKMETTVKETQKLQNPFRSQENRNTFHIRREIKKRAHSPDSGEENRKFFKSSRSRAVVTLNTNIKVEIDYGLRENDVSNEKISFDLTENLAVPEDFNSGCSINRILNILENDEAKESLNNPSPSFQNFLLSPTSEMCDLTSGLAINSPSKAKLNINPILDRCLTSNTLPKASDLETQKLFPMFYPNHKTQPDKKETSAVNSNLKNWKQLPKDQLLLDAGQKRFGATQCPVCKIVYHMGDPNDELMHKSYHEAGHILRFNGWKTENVICNFNDGRIIKISPNDPKVWWKKINDLMEVINRDLGYYELQLNMDNTQVFLYIKNKYIRGCIVAEPRYNGYQMLSSDGVDLCSEKSYPIKCGIARIWVHNDNRREGIGTALMNVLRSNFIYGYILDSTDIALSSPTEQGKKFAAKYFETDNFLIYI